MIIDLYYRRLWIDVSVDSNVSGQTDKQMGKRTCGLTDRQTKVTQKDKTYPKKLTRLTDKQTERRINRQTDGQT